MREMITKEAEKSGPFDLVIIDTSAAYFQGDDENNNVQAGAHARMIRSFVSLPGGPTIIVTCHSKTPDMSNLLPRGGGAFVAEMDGNLVCLRQPMSNPIVELYWQGKFRGPDFAPLLFRLRQSSSEKLRDTDGDPVWTVTAEPITDEEKTSVGRTTCASHVWLND
jgi:hypothetical protein